MGTCISSILSVSDKKSGYSENWCVGCPASINRTFSGTVSGNGSVLKKVFVIQLRAAWSIQSTAITVGLPVMSAQADANRNTSFLSVSIESINSIDMGTSYS